MKKTIAAITVGISLLSAGSGNLASATTHLDSSVSPVSGFANAMSLLDKNVFRKFDKAFPSATNATWYSEGKFTNFYFKEGAKVVRAKMNKQGMILEKLLYYKASELPGDVASLIRDNYKGYRLGIVTEVNVEDAVAYFVTLNGIDDWLQVKVQDGSVEVYKSFTY